MNMKLNNFFNKNKLLILQIIAIITYGSVLLYSDGGYFAYSLIILISLICLGKNYRNDAFEPREKSERFAISLSWLFAFMFTMMVMLANYHIWENQSFPDGFNNRFKVLFSLMICIILFGGGLVTFLNIFRFLVLYIDKITWKPKKNDITSKSAIITFWICFIFIISTRFIVLFLCHYPGVIISDTLNQVKQITTGIYNNHHPFYHTMVVKVFMSLGMVLFNNANAAVATYNVFQIVFTAFSFSYVVSTLATIGTPKWILRLVIAFFTFMPYHIMFAINMWKDTIFSCFVLLFSVFSFRCMKHIGKQFANYILFALSALGVCLFRSNGFFVFVLSGILFTILFGVKNKHMITILLSVMVIGYLMKHGVLNYLNVKPPDTIEALSIPAQQIARTIEEGNPLNDWEKDTLSKIIDVDRIAEEYQKNCSNPIKDLVREKRSQNLIVENKIDYLKLYISLGLKYPKSYFHGWVDETKGYWNAVYDYPAIYTGVHENFFGAELKVKSSWLNMVLSEYIWMFSEVEVLHLFMGIGICVWLHITAFFIGLIKDDRITVFLSSIIVFLDASLLIATPVWAEFRYIYPAFCTLPVVLVIALRPGEQENI